MLDMKVSQPFLDLEKQKTPPQKVGLDAQKQSLVSTTGISSVLPANFYSQTGGDANFYHRGVRMFNQ